MDLNILYSFCDMDNFLCSPAKTSAVHNFTCLYGPTGNVQSKATN